MLINKKVFVALLSLLISTSINQGCVLNDSGSSASSSSIQYDNYIADHNVARLSVLKSIPDSAINNAKTSLKIAYGHTSHGSQVVDGLNGLVVFMNGIGSTTDLYDDLDLRTDMGNYGSTYGASDLNQPDYTAWEAATRNYLSSHSDINVVVWSWCGGVGHASEAQITNYLSLMSDLESDYPNIKFIYMTGHLDGTGLTGNLHIRNEQIRTYCKSNGKWLFDFADIETYGPDGVYYGDKTPDDGCNYDSDRDGTMDSNWGTAWQNSHAVNVYWYSCSSAHSEAVNANMKAYAFWWLMARIAGWDGN